MLRALNCIQRTVNRSARSGVRVRAAMVRRDPLATARRSFAISENCLLDGIRTKREHTPHSLLRNIGMLKRLASGPQPESERLDLAADQAIAACGGDMRSAIRALILANEFLEYELCEMFKAVTNGRERGKIPDKRADWFD